MRPSLSSSFTFSKMWGIDGNAIDMATIGLGFIAVFIRPLRCFLRGKPADWSRQKAVLDALNGAALIPFLVMLASTFWTSLLPEVMKSKVSLGLAGLVGTIFILAEVMSAGSKDS